MDPVKIQKLQAMRRYRAMQNRFLINLVQYCLSLLCFGLFLSSPVWLPKLCGALRHFVLVSIPSMGMYLFCPKCFFVLGNVIVIFLVGESKLSGAAASTPDIYDEYMERSKTHQRTSPSVEKGKDAEVQRPASEENVRNSDGLKEDEVKVDEEEEEEEDEEEEEQGREWGEEEEEEGDGWEEEDRRDECFDGEDDNALPADELNRRIEDFIARVNKQRRLELLDCSG